MESVNVIAGFLTGGAIYVFAFVLVLGLIVFIHEFGHFQVGRWCGARVEAFSIGFGRSVAQWTDSKGTVWKIGWLPLGGYVKFWGDEDAISMSRKEQLEALRTNPDARACFHFKPLWQRAAVVAAGPAINLIFGVLLFAAIFAFLGTATNEPRLGEIQKGSVAESAGLQTDDIVTAIDGEPIDDFRTLVIAVRSSDGDPLRLSIERAGETLDVLVQPERADLDDGLGGKALGYRLGAGISRDAKVTYHQLGPVDAISLGGQQVYFIIERTFAFIGGLISGREDPKQISGPIGIGEKAGKAIQIGWVTLLMLMASVSVSIGLLNLFPIPMLDGGHLLFYAYEGVFGRPMGERAQEYGLRIGVALMLSLMLFATWNDLTRILGS